MKKNKLTFITTTLLITISIIYGQLKEPETKQIFLQNNQTNKYQTISFYKQKNYNRYINYHKKNKNLSNKDIVTQVNIGIDKPYYTNTKEAKKLNNNLILVNKYNYLSNNYIPNNLKEIDTKYAEQGMKLVDYAKEAFEKMAEDASKNNLKIIAMSTYRSYNYQNNLYNRYVQQDTKEKADTYSARPGYSEHQTGLAVDVYNKINNYMDFESTDEFKWMQENAHKYGFILRYPKNKEKITGYQYESWHYRYVGIKIATEIHKSNLTYDEYYIQDLDN